MYFSLPFLGDALEYLRTRLPIHSMTHMQSSVGAMVVRISGLPNDMALAESFVHKTIKKYCPHPASYRVSIVPSCVRFDQSNALVDFEALPDFLSSIKREPLGECQISIEGRDLSFDRHFIGLTQLYRPTTSIQADIIAITGLDGHAYGSWQGRGDLRRMWLRHSLSSDMPGCRTMIYGYKAKLIGRNFSTAEDYVIEFMGVLKTLRTKEADQRPIIFIAHSFGGLLLARSIIKAKQMNTEPALSSILGILFFAVPHLGIDVEDMSKIMSTGEHPRTGLLQSVSVNSQGLRSQLQDFVSVLAESQIKVVSFYETEQSRRLVQDALGGWKRTGEPYTSLEASNAILQLPSNIETRFPLHEDHSNISKFNTMSDRGYCIALYHMRKWIEQRSLVKPLADLNISKPDEPSSSNAKVDLSIRKPCYMIPFKNSRFLGREDKLEELEKRLFSDNKVQRVAIFGLGGMGKTQLALAYCYAIKEKHPDYSIFWVSALSAARFKHDYTEIAKKLNIYTDSPKDDLIQIVRECLSSEVAGKWLLVVDNSDDRNVLFDDDEYISAYLPRSEGGIILFTTRYKNIAVDLANSNVISLEKMDLEEAKVFLQQSIGRNFLPHEEQPLNDLLRKLTCLPLAIVQAASYINKNSISVSKYLDLMRGNEEDMIKLLSHDFWDNTRERESQTSVAMTWLVTFELIRHNEPGAAEILFQLAFLENEDIPRFILPTSGSEVDLTGALGILTGYSFLTKSGNTGTEMYNMHRLVHWAIKVWMQKQGILETWLVRTISHLVDISSPIEFHDWKTWRKYIPHAIRVLQNTGVLPSAQRANLCRNLAYFLEQDRRFTEAIKWRSEWVLWNRQSLPTDYSDLLNIEVKFAMLHIKTGRRKEALEIMETAAIKARELPEDIYDYLNFQISLASVYMSNERVTEAVEIAEKILANRVKVSVEDDEDQVRVIFNLSWMCMSIRQVGKAIELLEIIHPAMTGSFAAGEDRIQLESLLVMAYVLNGQVQKGLELRKIAMTKVLALAEDHPRRLKYIGDLGLSYASNGQLEELIELQEKNIALAASIFADNHPERLKAEKDLEEYRNTYRKVKKRVEEAEMTEINTRVLVEDHPDRLQSQSELALAYELDGQLNKAITLMQRVVSIQTQLQSVRHLGKLDSEADLSRMLDPNTNIWHAALKAVFAKEHEENMNPSVRQCAILLEGGELPT